jgi:hypothetical protein
MTAEQQDSYRIAAWDRYETTKTAYCACRAQLRKWGRLFTDLGGKLGNDLANVVEQDYHGIPNHQEFSKGLEDFQVASREFKAARQEAAEFGFTVNKDDPSV